MNTPLGAAMPRHRLRARWSTLVTGALLMLAAGCGTAPDASEPPAGADTTHIIVTTTIWGDLVGMVAGSDARVTVLFAANADPHDSALSAAQLASAVEADLVIANGLGLEGSALDALRAGVPAERLLELAPLLDPRSGDAEHDEDEGPDGAEDDDHDEHDGDDPHVWQDPIRVSQALGLIGERLAIVDPEDADAYERNAADARMRVDQLHDELTATYAQIPAARRTLVTNHDALGYLADRYDLEVVATVIPGGSTLAASDARALAALVALLRDLDARAIFVEASASSRVAETVAGEIPGLGIETLTTDALGPAGSGTDTWIGLMRTNADILVAALR